jgi:hypothetical protein
MTSMGKNSVSEVTAEDIIDLITDPTTDPITDPTAEELAEDWANKAAAGKHPPATRFNPTTETRSGISAPTLSVI